ncbi:MAG TPA: DNA polymerase III subunit gamma/tau, partial [Actinobacteria bacterium]|nr:DNA polymerase III subunit gamma/tau [Actinomycetota bacterium]
MEYQALYRKYRPQLFGEVVGQGHVTETLRREVAEGKVAHAYLFAGPRGTGKTTSARILAKALNCVDRSDAGEPCNVCDSCVAVTAGTSMDVVELDAASHNKVEDVRDIRVSVSTVASVGGAKRVFILDEAHMLTKAAGNALLKTLEEPPEHVHFVLATTEPYKLLDTIRSRSQRFDFQPLSIEVLATHLETICDLEGFEVEAGSLLVVARHAMGSARDALSLLEQVAALGSGSVDDAGVRRALGLAGRDAYLRIANAIAANDAPDGLRLVAELAGSGVDLRQFVGDAISFFRGVFLTQYGQDIELVVDEPPDVVKDWRTVGGVLEPAQVLRAIDLLSEALLKLREGREERLMLELSMLKLTRPEVSDDPAALSARIAKLEQATPHAGAQKVQEAEAVADRDQGDSSGTTPVVTDPKAEGTDAPASVREADVEEAGALRTEEPTDAMELEADVSAADLEDGSPSAVPTSADLDRIWPQLVAAVRELGARREAVFRESSPDGVEGSTVVLTVPAHLEFHLEQLTSDKELRTFVTDRASALLGSLVEVEFRIA